MIEILKRARPDVLELKAYQSARSLFKGSDDAIFLDANEAAFAPYVSGDFIRQYPNQQPDSLMDRLSILYGEAKRNILATRGADDAIDIIIRGFCVNGQDNIIICPPTFVMYAFSAKMQGADCREVSLDDNFQLDLDGIARKVDENTKCIFVCSPNNPTGNLMNTDDIITLCETYKDKALIIVDETYIEYAEEQYGQSLSLSSKIDQYDNLVILRTLSKAYGSAGLRCGSMIAHAELIAYFKKILPPYPLAQPVIKTAEKILSDENLLKIKESIKSVLSAKDKLSKTLQDHSDVTEVFQSDANFVLCRVKDAAAFMDKFRSQNIVLRDQSYQNKLENSIRISVGKPYEMDEFYAVLNGENREDSQKTRTAKITRTTKETDIAVTVDLDKTSPVYINTGVGFYDHMLDQIAKHGGISLQVECDGDLHIDPHHTIEDCAIALGQALKDAIGDKVGIERYGYSLPMDEAAAHVLLDLGGRNYLKFDADFPENHVGDLPSDMIEHIFQSMAEHMQANIHIAATGENTHHMVESIFKSFARALKMAIRKDGEALPSTKGIL